MWKRVAVCTLAFVGSVSAQEAMTTVAFERTADTEYSISNANNETEKVVPKALKLGPGIRIIDADGVTTFVPVIEAAGDLGNREWAGGSLRGSVAFKLIPEPTSGDASKVADQIRIDTGTFAVNLGASYSRFALAADDKDGPIGLEARLGTQIAYQRLSESTGTDDEGSSRGEEFAIISPELRVGAWLKYIYLGFKVAYNATSSENSAVAEEIDGSITEKAVMIIPVVFDSSNSDQPMFIEASYTSSDSEASEDVLSIALVKTFNVF